MYAGGGPEDIIGKMMVHVLTVIACIYISYMFFYIITNSRAMN